MKKIFGIGLALMMCFAFVVPAMAQDTQVPDATPVELPEGSTQVVTKEINVTESVSDAATQNIEGYFDKTKSLWIQVDKYINVEFDGHTIAVAADGEAETFGTQMNTENVFDDKTATKTVTEKKGRVTTTTTVKVPNMRKAEFKESITTNDGVVGVNQSPGNLNNQANLAAMAVVKAADELIEANGYAVQANLFNSIVSDRADKSDLIDNSISDNNGIIGINQSSGNMNNQLNSAAMSAGLGDVQVGALAEATLKQVTADNRLIHVATVSTDTISGSVTNNNGVVSLNQASGDMVSQANVCAIAANLQ
ncbi:MAG: hypothetical protein JRJ38_20400 [Deltaproteobacteria bacterium]|nr:hypothetical protein [Deltaproteobacteria bacterium]